MDWKEEEVKWMSEKIEKRENLELIVNLVGEIWTVTKQWGTYPDEGSIFNLNTFVNDWRNKRDKKGKGNRKDKILMIKSD
jgi:hypothetical protein